MYKTSAKRPCLRFYLLFCIRKERIELFYIYINLITYDFFLLLKHICTLLYFNNVFGCSFWLFKLAEKPEIIT